MKQIIYEGKLTSNGVTKYIVHLFLAFKARDLVLFFFKFTNIDFLKVLKFLLVGKNYCVQDELQGDVQPCAGRAVLIMGVVHYVRVELIGMIFLPYLA